MLSEKSNVNIFVNTALSTQVSQFLCIVMSIFIDFYIRFFNVLISFLPTEI